MKRNLIARFSTAVAAAMLFAMTAGNAFALNTTETGTVSPYWQADSATYTFVGITHPSVAGLASNVGMIVTPLNTSGAGPTFTNEGGSSVSNLTFTISAGATEKIFIVLTNQTSHPTPTSVPTAKFISITSTSGHSGALYIQPNATNPNLSSASEGGVNGASGGSLTVGAGRRAVEMLNVWGAVVVQSTSTGFAMEFVGDSHTSFFLGGVAPSAGPAAGTVFAGSSTTVSIPTTYGPMR